MQEKIELMQWLYENGVKPRMWKQEDTSEGVRWSRTPTISYRDRDGFQITEYYIVPWFPLEQVLEELPRIFSSGNYRYLLSLGVDSLSYLPTTANFGAGVIPWHVENVDGDYHLAALRLLKKVRENG